MATVELNDHLFRGVIGGQSLDTEIVYTHIYNLLFLFFRIRLLWMEIVGHEFRTQMHGPVVHDGKK